MDRYLKNILSTTEQFNLKDLECENLFVLRGARPDGIVVCGMGGSGLAGTILQHARNELNLNLPVFTWKNYGLPRADEFGLEHPFYVFISFSGDTEEIVSGFQAAVGKRGISYAAITTGGKLKKLAKQYHSPLVTFPALDLLPRQGVVKMLYALIQVLQAARLVSPPRLEYKLQARTDQVLGKKIAKAIFNKVAVIYSDREHEDLSYLWKISINETGKQVAFTNVLPELHHNEINGFQKSDTQLVSILLVPAKLSAQMKKRFLVTKEVLRSFGVTSKELPIPGKTRLESVWRTLILTEWVGYYLAKMHKVNPASTPAVDAIKRYLKK